MKNTSISLVELTVMLMIDISRSPTIAWSILGVMQFAAGVLIWLPKYRKYIAGFFFVFMLVFTMVHVVMGTYDIGGSVFMAGLLGLLVWSPSFLRGTGN